MTVNRTTLLDLPLPVTGTESGTWGDTTNNGLTQYVDIAIAGMSNLTSADFTAGALTIETTEGDSSATNISATSAQYAGFRVTSLAANSTITVGNTGTSPARSYRLINADATYSLTFKATGQTGVTLLPGQSALVAFNGTDYVIVGTVGAGSTTDNTVPRFDGTTGKILQSSGITIDDSNNVSGVAQLNITTLDATNIEVTNIKAKDGTAAASIADSTGVISVTANPILSGGTANGVLYLNGSKVATSGSALTFDGANLGVGTTALSGGKFSTLADLTAANGLVVRDSATTYANNDNYVLLQNSAGATAGALTHPASASMGVWGNDDIRFLQGSGATEQMRLTSTGLGIGTSSPNRKLEVNGISRFTDGTTNFEIACGGGVAYAGPQTNSPLAFQTNNTERMRLDSSGNLGLGVTPSAWGSSRRALQVGLSSVFAGSPTEVSFADLSANSFVSSATGNFAYINTGAASLFRQINGAFEWRTAASGTAGNAITFTQAMTLDDSGNLLVGTTTSSGDRIYVSGYVRATSGFKLDGSTYIDAPASETMRFVTNNTERARITSGGDLLVGKTASDASTKGCELRTGFATLTSDDDVALYLRRNTSNGDIVQFRSAAALVGSISVTSTATAYNTSSDYRLKDNPQPLTSSGAFIDALKPKTWNWKADGSRGVGFIAHEVQEVSPGSVVGEKDGEQMQAMEYGSAEFIANIIAELQSLRQRVALLEGN